MSCDKKYQVMPDMPAEQFEALKQDIAERGILTPIDIDEEGRVLDGHHRIRACEELGITDYPTIIRPGLSEEEKRIFARKSNMMRRHLSRGQIREIIRLQLIDSPRWADNRIAKELGVDSKTVGGIREKLEATSEIPKFEKYLGADGKERPGINRRGIVATDEIQRERILKQLRESLIDVDGIPDGFFDTDFIILKAPEPTEEERKALEKWNLFFEMMIEEHKIRPPTTTDWIMRHYEDPEDFIKYWPPLWWRSAGESWKKSKRVRVFEEEALRRIREGKAEEGGDE